MEIRDLRGLLTEAVHEIGFHHGRNRSNATETGLEIIKNSRKILRNNHISLRPIDGINYPD